ncbi:MAG: hypothetical protein PHO66_04330 [Eubacteriales bacterium]|nr:hypothetical protein [Eubacteriales bacterium]
MSYYKPPYNRLVTMEMGEFAAAVARLYEQPEQTLQYGTVRLTSEVSQTGITYTWAPGLSARLVISADGTYFFDRPCRNTTDGIFYPAGAVCADLLEAVMDELGCTFARIQDVRDIQKARLLLTRDGQTVLDKTIAGGDARALEEFLAGAQLKYTPSTFVIGPALILTRQDGSVLHAAVDITQDWLVLEPWLFYDYGPADEHDATREFLSFFDMDGWPAELEQWERPSTAAARYGSLPPFLSDWPLP